MSRYQPYQTPLDDDEPPRHSSQAEATGDNREKGGCNWGCISAFVLTSMAVLLVTTLLSNGLLRFPGQSSPSGGSSRPAATALATTVVMQSSPSPLPTDTEVTAIPTETVTVQATQSPGQQTQLKGWVTVEVTCCHDYGSPYTGLVDLTGLGAWDCGTVYVSIPFAQPTNVQCVFDVPSPSSLPARTIQGVSHCCLQDKQGHGSIVAWWNGQPFVGNGH